jgi:hypothetical protein
VRRDTAPTYSLEPHVRDSLSVLQALSHVNRKSSVVREHALDQARSTESWGVPIREGSGGRGQVDGRTELSIGVQRLAALGIFFAGSRVAVVLAHGTLLALCQLR